MDRMLLAFSFGPSEMVLLGIIAVLLFGQRLPEVGRSLGKSLMELRKSFDGIQSELRSAMNDAPRPTASQPAAAEDREEATAPKFEPPPPPSETGGAAAAAKP